MQILHLLSGGLPAALLDMRWLDASNGIWTLANCGAIPAAFAATAQDPSGLSGVRLVPHVFGRGGGGALPMVVGAQQVTLARLCRRRREYWMALVPGQVQDRNPAQLARTTAAFPQAFVRTKAGEDFLQVFGSNHVHMVSGDWAPEVKSFCSLKGIECRLWE
jgi:L-fucose isomerase